MLSKKKKKKLNNLTKGKTCIKADSGTSADVMLTNKPRSFHKTSIMGTDFSDMI